MNYEDKIIEFCKKNRVSTTEVADALGKSGVLEGPKPLNENFYKVGKVRTIFTANNSNFSVHEQIIDVEEGDVVIIFAHNCNERAIIGDLIAKFLTLYKGAAALVVVGNVRDVSALKREKFPIWSTGFSPLGCYNTPAEGFPKTLESELREKYNGGVAICDDGGVAVISKKLLNKNVLERLHRIEMQEDIWFYCLDTLKWDTKKIVCDKDYLNNHKLFSDIQIEKIKDIQEPLDEKD